MTSILNKTNVLKNKIPNYKQLFLKSSGHIFYYTFNEFSILINIGHKKDNFNQINLIKIILNK